MPARERLVGLDDLRLVGVAASGGDGHAQPGGQLGHDAVLHREDLVHAAVDLDRADHGPGLDVGEEGGHADAIAEALVSAPEHPARAELAPQARGEVLLAHRPGALQLPQDLVGALAADHGEALDRPQVGGDRLRDAGAQPFVLGHLGDVVEARPRPPRAPPPRPVQRARRASAAADRLQVGGHLAHRLRPAVRVLGQHAAQQADQRRRRRDRPARRGRADPGGGWRPPSRTAFAPRERLASGEQLVDHDARARRRRTARPPRRPGPARATCRRWCRPGRRRRQAVGGAAGPACRRCRRRRGRTWRGRSPAPSPGRTP